MLSNRECAEICDAVGHAPAGVLSATATKHRFECSCGYVSTYRRTFQEAVQAGILHMRKVAQHAVANGAEIPGVRDVAV